MPRVRGRDIEQLRRVTEKVVIDLIARGLSDVDGRPDDLLREGLDEVAAEVSRRSDDRITSGFLQSQYENKGALVTQALQTYLGPDTSDAKSTVEQYVADLDAGADPVAARGRLAESDLRNMTEKAPEWTRLGWSVHGRAAQEDLRKPLAAMYRAFDEVMIPAYERDLKERGRHLRDGISMEDLAAAYTAAAEGLALRALASDDPERYHRLAASMAEALTHSMTEPDEDEARGAGTLQ